MCHIMYVLEYTMYIILLPAQNLISWVHYQRIHTSEIDFSSRAELKLDNEESSDDKTLETPCQNCGEGKGEAQKTPVGRRG